MEVRYLCALLTVIVWTFVCECKELKPGDPNVCIISMRFPESITVQSRCGNRPCVKKRTVYVTRKSPVCCSGYYFSNTGECLPDCPRGCERGICTAPETCVCEPPLVLRNNNTCDEPLCSFPCVNANCARDDTCVCHEGHEQHNATHCAPICSDGFESDPQTLECKPKCDLCINGTCTAPNTCTCDEGYILENSTCIPHCSQPCRHGKCVKPDTCECDVGYSFDSEDKSVCRPVCADACVNATCIEPNKCACDLGYEPLNSRACKPRCDQCNYGVCEAPNQCRCLKGYSKTAGLCRPVCSQPCTNGRCSAPETCECEEGYELGSDRFKCHPVCKSECINGTCVSPDTCACDPGYDKLDSNVCTPKCDSCELGSCVSPGNCRCKPGYVRANGTCSPVCSIPCVNGFCESPEKCACNEGYMKNSSYVCHKPCTGCNNGVCDIDGKCSCDSGFHWFNGSCITPEDCNACNSTCVDGECNCADGRPCQPVEMPAEVASTTRLAGLQLTWLLGGCTGVLLVSVVIITIGYLWRKRKEYDGKPTDNGNTGSVVYTIPNTLMQRSYGDEAADDITEEDEEEDPNKEVSHHLLETRGGEDAAP